MAYSVYHWDISQSFAPITSNGTQSFADLLFSGSLIMSIGMTMWRLVAGFSISIILGVGTGLLMVRFRDFGKTMSSFAVGLQSFPSIAWVPFAILLVGLNDFGILFVVVLDSIFSVMISTYSGIRNINAIYLRALKIWAQLVCHCSRL